MKIIFIDETPLAGLVAMDYISRHNGGSPAVPEFPAFLARPRGLLPAGRDAEGNEVYALWLPASAELLVRLAESFIRIHQLPPEACRIVRGRPRGAAPRLASMLYRQGFPGAARRLLLWNRGRGIDGAGELVDNG